MLATCLAATCWAGEDSAAEHPEAARLRLRSELSRQNKLFVEHRADAVEVLAAGWKLKRFRHDGLRYGPDRPVRLTQVAEVNPLAHPPERVLDVGSMEAPDPSGTAGSKEEIVGVEQMPDVFVVRFDDGTVWLVWTERWGGVGWWLKKHLLQIRLLTAVWRAEESAPLWIMRTDPESARHLYWVLQKGFQVIQ